MASGRSQVVTKSVLMGLLVSKPAWAEPFPSRSGQAEPLPPEAGAGNVLVAETGSGETSASKTDAGLVLIAKIGAGKTSTAKNDLFGTGTRAAETTPGRTSIAKIAPANPENFVVVGKARRGCPRRFR